MKKIMTNLQVSFTRFRWLYAVLILFVLVGCSNAPIPVTDTPVPDEPVTPDPTAVPVATEQENTPVPTPTRPNIAVDPADLSGISIRFAHPWAGEAAEIFEDIARAFSLTNPWNIWVDVEAYGSETALLETLQVNLESGDTPSLIAAHPYYLSALEGFSSVDLFDYIDHEEWGLDDDEKGDIPQIFLDHFTTGEILRALPVAPQATVLFFNETWAEEIGYAAIPSDDAAFSAQACAATEANLADVNIDNDGTGGWLINFDPNVMAGWYLAFDGKLAQSATPQFNDDAGQDAFGYLKSVYDDGCIWIGRQPEPYFYFANRYALMYAGTLDQIPAQTGWMSQAENEDQWASIGFPGPNGETTMIVNGPGLSVTSDTLERQMAAWLFAKHLIEPEIQARIVRNLYTLPVRNSAMQSLSDLEREYPQWGEAVSMLDIAETVPVSEGWGIAQWVLQDAAYRIFQAPASEMEAILEELDSTIEELEGMSP